MKKHLLILWIFSAQFIAAFASVEVRSTFMTTGEGLASNTIRYIFQDSKGFIWLGTLNGLNRYDGYSCVTFRPEEQGKISLADLRIKNMYEDKKGLLWISTTPDLYSCYDLKRERFVDFTGCGEYQHLYAHLFPARNGDIWLWRNGSGCRRIIYEDNEFLSVEFSRNKQNLQSDDINYLYEDKSGKVWIGTESGVSVVQGNTTSVVLAKHRAKAMTEQGNKLYFLSSDGEVVLKEGNSQNRIIARLSRQKNIVISGVFRMQDQWIIFTNEGGFQLDLNTERLSRSVNLDIKNGEVLTDSQGDCWIINRTGMVRFISIKTGKIKDFQLMPSDKIKFIDQERYHIVRDSRGLIWISTYGNGLFVYDESSDELQHFVSNINGFSHIRSNFLQYVMEDYSGNIWVASEYTGISRLSVINDGAVRIFPEDKNLSDRSNAVRLIKQMRNHDYWVGTRSGGLYVYDSNLHSKGQKRLFQSNIYSVLEDTDGTVWLGSRGNGLCIGDSWYMHEADNAASLSDNNIFTVYRDSKGHVWIGTFGGGLNLAVKGANGYTFKHFFTKNYNQSRIRVITEDKNGWIWVGTSDGIVIFQPERLMINPNDYITYSYSGKNLSGNEIKCLYQDRKGQMWVGISGTGISVCKIGNNYRNLQFKEYNTGNGLANDMVSYIIEDKAGNLWISTEYGISRFDSERNVFENFYFSTYSLGNVYSENCGCMSPDGTLLFGTNYGMVSISPEKIGHDDALPVPEVTLTNLHINGVYMNPEEEGSPLVQSLTYTDEIELKYHQNSFVIDFSIFEYSVNKDAKYTFKLEHFDKNWSVPSSLNFAAYKNLAPGTYHLHIKAMNGAGVWSKEKVLTIIVKPPFWKTTWAYLFYFILTIVLFWAFYRLIRYFNDLRNRVEIEKQLTEYKLVFFTNISHEFRTSLTLIQGALEKMEENKVPKEMAYSMKIMDKSTNRLLRLINQLLEFRKMQNNKLALSLEETDVIAFVYELFLSFKDAAESKNMNFQFSPSKPAYNMYVDKEKLDKIVYNLLSNAFKYTPSGGKILLSVQVNEVQGHLQISVADNGVGIPKDKQAELFQRFMQSSFSGHSVGVGLHLTHELVQVHKGMIEFKENEGGGSIFTVTLPTDTSVYEEKDFLVPHNVLLEEEYEHHQKEVKQDIVKVELPENEPLNKRKVLIIEDDNDIRDFLKREIGAYFEVMAAADGETGLQCAHSFDADLIVCDVMMPGINGFEVTRNLKNDFETSHIPVILLTAMSADESQLKGVESGADIYVTKPFRLKLLLARIFQLIEQRDKLREKFSGEPNMAYAAICTTDKDKAFADRLNVIMEQQISNAQFTVDEFAAAMDLGRTVFYRKVRGVTGYSPNEYIRVMRMKKAAELLLENKYTVSEVSYHVGISDPFYFSKCFKQQFGVSPSVYQRGADKEKNQK